MKEKPTVVAKILSLFDKIWFSDTILGLFIFFPAGMWIMMALAICASILTEQVPLLVSMILFTVGCFLTVFRAWIRSLQKNDINDCSE
jgi:hypothetical protein